MSDVLVIGLGKSGMAASKKLLEMGEKVWAVDKNSAKIKSDGQLEELLHRGMLLVEEEKVPLHLMDYILVSPGVPSAYPPYHRALESGKPIIGEVEFASRVLPNKTWIGITGTNGKTTVTLLVTHVLNHAGLAAKALGNVGLPLSSYQSENKDEIIVAELSSYQLETLSTPILSTALLLNVTPDHLDRYDSMHSYAAAKFRIGNCLAPNGVFFIEEKCAKQWPQFYNQTGATYGYEPASTFFTDGEEIYIRGAKQGKLPLDLIGKRSHHVENLLAAFAACYQMGISWELFKEAFTTFKLPAHRIEFIKELQGVLYYDDSKGTNLDAVIRAVSSMKGQVILIAGGVHKGVSYTPWLEFFQGKVRSIYAIGEAASLMKQELNSLIPVQICTTLKSAVEMASCVAEPGDAVLLSPGCSSFDMFRDYAHRGEEFKKCVEALG